VQAAGPVQGVVMGGNNWSLLRSSASVGDGAIRRVVGAGVGSDREIVEDGAAGAIDDDPDSVDSSSSIDVDMLSGDYDRL
jgi:hypothetical protein